MIITDLSKHLSDLGIITDSTKLSNVDYYILAILKKRAVGYNKRMKAENIIFTLDWEYGVNLNDGVLRYRINKIRKHYSHLSIESKDTKYGGYYIRSEKDTKSNHLLRKAMTIIETMVEVGLPEERIENINALFSQLNGIVRSLDLPPNHQLKMKLTGNERDEVHYTGDHYNMKGVTK